MVAGGGGLVSVRVFVVAFVVEKGCWKRSVTLVEGRFGFDLLSRDGYSHRGSNNNSSDRGRSSNNRGGFSGGRGRGRRPPHCQLCRNNGHYASNRPDLHSYATRSPKVDANLATAFHP
ncbi:hypothetical protein LXL04_035621 [Taraxacum kok-saghyz]